MAMPGGGPGADRRATAGRSGRRDGPLARAGGGSEGMGGAGGGDGGVGSTEARRGRAFAAGFTGASRRTMVR